MRKPQCDPEGSRLALERKGPPIGQVSREIIEFAIRKYVEATGEEPNVVIEQREELDRKCWVLTIEISGCAMINSNPKGGTNHG